MWLILISIVLWIILSGYFSALPLVPGLIFIVVGFYLLKKAKKSADFKEKFSIHPLQFLLYIPYMFKEIYNSNVFVVKAILKNKTKPHAFVLPNTFKTQSGTTIFANSVTLTPGTIILNADAKNFVIHALTQETKDGVFEYEMYNRVLRLEKTLPEETPPEKANPVEAPLEEINLEETTKKTPRSKTQESNPTPKKD